MAVLKLYFRSPAAIIGLLLLLAILAMAASAGWLYPRDPLSLAGRPLIWPFENPRFLLGTDNSGRDIAAQIFHGARFSLLIGLVATVIAIIIGIVHRRVRRLLRRLDRQHPDARHRGVPDPAELPAAARARRGVRLDHHDRDDRDRHRLVARARRG